MGKNTSSHLLYAHYIRIYYAWAFPRWGLPTYNMRGFEGGICGIREKIRIPHAFYAWANMRILCVGKYAWDIRGWQSQNGPFKAFSHVRAGLYCSRRIIERGQICVYYAWANMRGIYVGGSPKMALFTRNADVIRWEFPPSFHAYYTWGRGECPRILCVGYAWANKFVLTGL